jgi:hypothetical protein
MQVGLNSKVSKLRIHYIRATESLPSNPFCDEKHIDLYFITSRVDNVC